MTHARMTGKISNWNSLQTHCPRGKQMKTTVPREIVDPRRRFEKNNGRTGSLWRFLNDQLRFASNFEIVEVTN
jgi:hypothetical protein